MANGEDLLGPNSLPPFAALRAFEAVFRTGGIRKAATHLGLNHAVISRHLRLLEDWLGEPLVLRAGNRLALTENGIQFHARMSAAMLDMAQATREFRGRQDLGHVRLCCVPGLSIQWLSGQLADFERDYPQFDIELKPSDVAPNLLLREADVDIRYVRDGDSAVVPRGLRTFELARPDIMAVASPAIASRLNQGSDVALLLNETLLHEEHQGEWASWLEINGVKLADKLPGPLCWHAHLAIAAARLGRGVALASRFLVDADLASGELREVCPGGARRVPLGSYTLIAREDRWSAPALAALRRFLRGRAKDFETEASD